MFGVYSRVFFGWGSKGLVFGGVGCMDVYCGWGMCCGCRVVFGLSGCCSLIGSSLQVRWFTASNLNVDA